MPASRAGLAFGPVLARGGDYFGRAVNLASRLVDVRLRARCSPTPALSMRSPTIRRSRPCHGTHAAEGAGQRRRLEPGLDGPPVISAVGFRPYPLDDRVNAAPGLSAACHGSRPGNRPSRRQPWRFGCRAVASLAANALTNRLSPARDATSLMSLLGRRRLPRGRGEEAGPPPGSRDNRNRGRVLRPRVSPLPSMKRSV